MIQYFYWVYAEKNWKQTLEELFVNHIHRSIFHNSWKVGAIQVFTDGWMDKQNEVYT